MNRIDLDPARVMETQPGSIRQLRALFFVFDGGTGIGHLRRLSRIAGQMQGRFACLVVTGHAAAATWLVPQSCEFVHLPSWDSLVPGKSRYWKRRPFYDVDLGGAIKLRRSIIEGVMRGFRPDAIFVDHLPLGANEELSGVIRHWPCRKYLVTRGVLNETEDLRRLILGGNAHAALRQYYDRILVAADRRVVDFGRAYNLDPELRAKTVTTGYVAEPVSEEEIAAARSARGLKAGDRWVVCSAGGGQTGERILEASLAIARQNPEFAFDIILGPRSSLDLGLADASETENGRVRVFQDVPDLAIRHASADLVISSGGYNSMLEALQGNARILCVPLRSDPRDEQTRHAIRLGRFADVRLVPVLSDLPAAFAAAAAAGQNCLQDRRAELDLRGAAVIERLVTNDLVPRGTSHAAS